MKDPARLLESVVSEPELRLLRAAVAEEPPPDALQRLADKLSVRVSSVEPIAVDSAASTTARAAKLSAVGSKLPLGAIVFGAAGLMVALGATLWLSTRSNDARPAVPPASVPVVQQPQPSAPAPVSAPAPEHSVEAHPVPAAGDALAQEIARLDAVRGLLAANHLAPALGALQSYERDYAHGALRQEATLLRIEVLHRAGRRNEARALAEHFLAIHPDSPHGPRIRALVFGSRNAR
jgi:hypothetical protein